MKKEIRLLGIDDAPFSFTDKYVPIIGVIMRGNSYIECVLKSTVSVDGTDATAIVIEMINTTKHKQQLKAVLLDGIALGGFNIINIETLFNETMLPVCTITRDKPNYKKMKIALEKNFGDWETRWELLNKGPLYTITTKHNPIYIEYIGLSLEEAKEIINISTIRGVIPEPLRVAHIIASGITRGESYGKA
jgi:endonuclease V-like protein UPF0215 family